MMKASEESWPRSAQMGTNVGGEDLLDTASIGRIAREGVRAVIVGKPNAGKSSLMNALLGEGRVIVTDDAVIRYLESMSTDHMLVVINKNDLGSTVTEDSVESRLPGAKIISTSLIGKGAIEAAEKISEAVGSMFDLESLLRERDEYRHK